jgi:hypothetical protein
LFARILQGLQELSVEEVEHLVLKFHPAPGKRQLLERPKEKRPLGRPRKIVAPLPN